MEHIGIRGPALSWFKSYLTNRIQFVQCGNQKSDSDHITCGVPQGSILGPLMFLVYINDIKDLPLKGKVKLYADDTNIVYTGKSINVLINYAQRDLDALSKWFVINKNKLAINTKESKSHYIIIRDPRK